MFINLKPITATSLCRDTWDYVYNEYAGKLTYIFLIKPTKHIFFHYAYYYNSMQCHALVYSIQ